VNAQAQDGGGGMRGVVSCYQRLLQVWSHPSLLYSNWNKAQVEARRRAARGVGSAAKAASRAGSTPLPSLSPPPANAGSQLQAQPVEAAANSDGPRLPLFRGPGMALGVASGAVLGAMSLSAGPCGGLSADRLASVSPRPFPSPITIASSDEDAAADGDPPDGDLPEDDGGSSHIEAGQLATVTAPGDGRTSAASEAADPDETDGGDSGKDEDDAGDELPTETIASILAAHGGDALAARDPARSGKVSVCLALLAAARANGDKTLVKASPILCWLWAALNSPPLHNLITLFWCPSGVQLVRGASGPPRASAGARAGTQKAALGAP